MPESDVPQSDVPGGEVPDDERSAVDEQGDGVDVPRAPSQQGELSETAEPSERARHRSRAAGVAGALALVVAGAGIALPVPYVVERPGPVVDTLGSQDGRDLIAITGATTYPTTGSLDLTTVSISGGPGGSVDLPSLVAAWLLPSRTAIPYDLLFAPGTTAQEEEARDTADMTNSQDSATAAALTELGYDVPTTVTVAAVDEGSLAARALRPGDVVLALDGEEVDGLAGLRAALDAGPAGRTVALTVRRDGEDVTLEVPTQAAPDDAATSVQLGVGVDVDVDRRALPVEVDIAVDDIGGPSAGLMFALGIVDRLTPGPMTGGQAVAGTGTIDVTGAVGPIGGITEKMAAARSAGADAFLAPEGNCDEVVRGAPAGLVVVPVADLGQARDAVEAVGRGETDALATCAAGS